jgi:hypothetical protein
MSSPQKNSLAYDTNGGMALDFAGGVTVDKMAMSATCVFSTPAEDREGDVMDLLGLRTANHQRNPIVFWNHAKTLTLPIGKTRDDMGQYTVEINDDFARQTTFFSQTLLEAEQIFDLIAEGIVNANSIGFQTLKATPLYTGPKRRGLHILESDLLEVSWVGVPVNQEAVRKALDSNVCGRPLASAIRRELEPYAARASAWANGVTLKCYAGRAVILKSVGDADAEATEEPTASVSSDATEAAADEFDEIADVLIDAGILDDPEAVADFLVSEFGIDNKTEARVEWANDLMAEYGNGDRLMLTEDEDGEPVVEIADAEDEEKKGLRFWNWKSFDESEHPRDHGKFSEKPGASGDTDGPSMINKVHEVSPDDLTPTENEQAHTDAIAEMFPKTSDMPPIVYVLDDGQKKIIDGHNRWQVASDRGDKLRAIGLTSDEYEELKLNYLQMEIVYGALMAAGQSDAAESLDERMGGIVSTGGYEAAKDIRDMHADEDVKGLRFWSTKSVRV